jgi:hypothetical protein
MHVEVRLEMDVNAEPHSVTEPSQKGAQPVDEPRPS